MSINEIVERLLGCPHAVGSFEVDEIRYINLKNYCSLAENVLSTLIYEARGCEDPRFSVKRNGQEAFKFLSLVYETLGEVLEELKENETN